MKFHAFLLFGASASAAAISSRQAGGNLQKGDQTLVLKEVGGVPGNECLTFRNNGESTAIHAAICASASF